ncbi:hypothetical protein EYM_04165 [Ignicoccus islandicus DSM 13165]|uniref:Phosphoglycolate phosphatase n=1 Tax=Ignicoccus islandicus DSM 13165 TaxID=940295 RepID=A0A0U3F901_9CREN|nr:phosphoglycolate phosphatase [Ignicoccus islandicus]ALU12472.1 hypothetical protein EYM_04165 [Ignicoccus islandicus DSM 13165]
MDLSKVEVVAADVDGTLTEGISFVLDIDAIKALRELERYGIRVILVSGNSFPIVATLKRYLGTSAPTVFENGCGVGDFNWRELVVDEELCNVAKEAAEILLKVLSTNGWKPSWQNPWRMCDFALNSPTGEVKESDAQKAEEILREFGYLKHGIRVKASRHAIHVMPERCGKGLGVERILKRFGIPLEKLAAVGDAENDLDMIKLAGIGVAVSDAQDVLKKHADIVTPYPAGKGFAWFAKELLKARGLSS